MSKPPEDNLYDHPKYYDLVFGSDWKAEFDFLQDVFKEHGKGNIRRVFEPGCGTGRLMYRLAQAGYDVAGNDLNPAAVDYCNKRIAKYGFPPTAVVGDMSDFAVKKKYDAAFNMINTFRHLPTEDHARRHLECMADAVKTGGLYLLGLHLTPTKGEPMEEESWAARRGHLAVLSHMQTVDLDRKRRVERVRMRFDIYKPTETRRLESYIDFRTYTAAQMRSLLAKVPSWRVVATYDFAYRIDRPVTIGPETEDVVYVLQKRGNA